MFSFFAKTIGQVLGEVVHQTGEIAKDIMDMPAALMAGYDEELIPKKTPTVENTTTPPVATDVENS